MATVARSGTGQSQDQEDHPGLHVSGRSVRKAIFHCFPGTPAGSWDGSRTTGTELKTQIVASLTVTTLLLYLHLYMVLPLCVVFLSVSYKKTCCI